MRRSRATALIVAISAVLTFVAINQSAIGLTRTELESLAREALEKGRFSEALAQFASLGSQYPDSPHRDQWLYNQARSRYHLGQLDDAEREFERLVQQFPTSQLTPFAHRFLAEILYRRAEIEDAIQAYFAAFKHSKSVTLDSLCVQSLREIKAQFPDALAKGMGEVDPSDLTIARRNALSRALGVDVGSRSSRRAVRSLSRKSVVIALPLTGSLQSYGERIERGARLAFENNELSQGAHRLDLLTIDTHGSPVEAARVAQRAQDEDALGIIGPLTSEEAAAVSAALRCGDVPAIAPAASQSDFTSLSNHMFQMTPSPGMIGRFLAEYAYLGMPVPTAAALAPNSLTEKEMAEAFVDRFTGLGGTIVAFEIFPPRATDFGAFARKIKDHFLEAYQENATLITTGGDTLDLDEAPVEIGCLFIPASAQQLQLILPQINYHNITTTLIGSDGMAAQSVWELKLQNVREMLFTSLLTNDPGNEVYRSFAEKYRNAHTEPPDRLAALGYDAAMIILQAFNSGASDSRSLAKSLMQGVALEGASGWIQFSEDRINHAIALFRVEDGVPTRVDWTSPISLR